MSKPRPAEPSLVPVDAYCHRFRALFPDVRTYEHFTALLTGLLSDLPRKTLPALARFLGLSHAQGLHHLVTTRRLDTDQLRGVRTELVRTALGDHPVTLIIDETGDRKKGTTTDYVSRQYLGSLGKIEQGLVTVHVIALVGEIVVPLLFDVFKPKSRLKPGEAHRTKIEIAAELLREIATWGLTVELVVADALYGEASTFVNVLEEQAWPYVLAIRSDHALWVPSGTKVRRLRWRKVERHLTDGRTETRYVQEVVWGARRRVRYFLLTTDPETQPAESTSFVMTTLPEEALPGRLADAYGRRMWVEHAFRQMKTELGWHDWRLTRWAHIRRWYELVLSVFTLVSLEALGRARAERGSIDEPAVNERSVPESEVAPAPAVLAGAPWWRGQARWKATLEDLRSLVRVAGASLVVGAWLAWLGGNVGPITELLAQLKTLPFPY